MKQVIFTLANARSGTLFLCELFRRNARDCTCRHEPFFDWGNPTLLGPAICDAYAGRLERLRGRLAKKRDYIERLDHAAYLESSHAFLKSAYLVALEFFPQMQLIHLIRDPVKVAKSEAYREEWRRRLHAPFHYYRGEDGCRHFFWALTQREEIFQLFAGKSLSLFQRYLLQWIEIENRAMSFLNQHHLHARCFTLHSPEDLNNPDVIAAMFEFLNLKTFGPAVVLGGRKNRSLGPRTIIRAEDLAQAAEVLRHLPAKYLEIFRHDPYASRPWIARLVSLALAGPSASILKPADDSSGWEEHAGFSGNKDAFALRASFPFVPEKLKELLRLLIRLLLGVVVLFVFCAAFLMFNLFAICSDARPVRPK